MPIGVRVTLPQAMYEFLERLVAGIATYPRLQGYQR